MALRIGAVSYLNSKPLIYGLQSFLPKGSEICLDLPSRLADQLRTKELDIGLIPSIEFFSDPNYLIYSDVCIACRGPVWSVKVFFRTHPSQVRSLALDEGSRTSIALAKILFADRYAIRPKCKILPIDGDPDLCDCDAVLMIGDRAMKQPGGNFPFEWDLGQEWMKDTGLPFVFAMWVGLYNQEAGKIQRALGLARDYGVSAIDLIAQQNAHHYGLSVLECRKYLSSHLHFTLGEREMEGLTLFYQKASQMGLAPTGRDPATFSVTTI